MKFTLSWLKEHLPGYEFARGDIRATPFLDARFDAYLSWGVFEHFENGLGECISEAHRILKPGGLLCVSVPYQNWRHILRDSRHLTKWDPEFDSKSGYTGSYRFYQWRLSREELRRELELHGFQVLQLKSIHKEQGVQRWLQWDFPLFKEGSVMFKVLRRAFSWILPSWYVSHMIVGVARRRE